MARLVTSGFETQMASTTATQGGEGNADGATSQTNGTPTYNTSVQRSGAACLSCAAVSTYHRYNFTGVLDRTYYIRFYVRFAASPSAVGVLANIFAGATFAGQVRVSAGDAIYIVDANQADVGSRSAAVSTNTWYRVEVEIMVPTASNGTMGLWLDGTQIARSTAVDVNNAALTRVDMGICTASDPGVTVLLDDVAINDNQGTEQNGLPNEGKIVLLKPVSHSAIGNWVGPQTTGDDTTSLNDNVDNTPPTGVAHSDADANAGKYVFNITNSANQNFDMNVTDYTTAGVGSTDVVRVCQALARMSVSTTTGTNTGAVSCVSNPAITADTGNNLELTAVAGTEPAGWKTFLTAPVYDPSVTKGTSPVVRATKEVANTNPAMIDLMGLVVEYQAERKLGTISSDDTTVYVAGLGATATTATYGGTTLGAATSTAQYPPP